MRLFCHISEFQEGMDEGTTSSPSAQLCVLGRMLAFYRPIECMDKNRWFRSAAHPGAGGKPSPHRFGSSLSLSRRGSL